MSNQPNTPKQPQHAESPCPMCGELHRLTYYPLMNYWSGTCDNRKCVLYGYTLDIDDKQEKDRQIRNILGDHLKY